MGRVFDTEDIERGRVPTPKNFENAVEAFGAAVEEGIEDGLIDGGVIFGSAAIRAANLRSDLDCMIVPVDASDDALESAGAVISHVDWAGNYSIPINASLHHRKRLEAGEHEIDRFFGHHLTSEHRIVTGTDPATYIRFSETPPDQILFQYLRHKKRTINSVVARQGTMTEWYKGMQRLLELPLAVGRKALMALDELEGTKRATSDSANKPLVTVCALQLYEELSVSETARRILELDRNYTEVLTRTIDGQLTYDDYAGFVDDSLGVFASETSRWLDKLDTSLQARLSHTST